jgi:hypothetical protein
LVCSFPIRFSLTDHKHTVSIMPLGNLRCLPKLCPNREAREEAETANEGQAGAALSGLLWERNRSAKTP